MKKLTTIVALALFISAGAFADPGKKTGDPKSESKVTEKVKAAFEKKFNGAVEVSWSKASDFYFADFKLKENNFSAAYNETGDLLGMSRKIYFSQLPFAAQQALQEKFPDYNISIVGTEIFFEEQTNYYLAAENNAKLLKIKCSPTGDITIEKTTRKKKLVGSVY